jgi:thymidine kinase
MSSSLSTIGEKMAKLYFYYGAMGSSKTANAIMNEYNFKKKEKKTIFLKPIKDNRESPSILKSRTGLETNVIPLKEYKDITNIVELPLDYIFIDEAQFLTKTQIQQLSMLVDTYNINIFCYGLRTDFMGNFFEGALELMKIADTIIEIKTICWCGKKATMNARIYGGKMVLEGEQIQIGGDESYVALCRAHWKEGKLKPNKDEIWREGIKIQEK